MGTPVEPSFRRNGKLAEGDAAVAADSFARCLVIVKITNPVIAHRQYPYIPAWRTLLPGGFSDTLTPFMVVERRNQRAGIE
jgi:hypothetical protein